MKKKYLALRVEYSIIIFLLLFGLYFFFKGERGEVSFCRGIFKGLVEGRYSVARLIDWDNLKAFGIDSGLLYRETEKAQREGYVKGFILGFGSIFKKQGGGIDMFSNWRIYEKADSKITIAADLLSHKKTLLLTLSGGRKRRLIGLEYKDLE